MMAAGDGVAVSAEALVGNAAAPAVRTTAATARSILFPCQGLTSPLSASTPSWLGTSAGLGRASGGRSRDRRLAPDPIDIYGYPMTVTVTVLPEYPSMYGYEVSLRTRAR